MNISLREGREPAAKTLVALLFLVCVIPSIGCRGDREDQSTPLGTSIPVTVGTVEAMDVPHFLNEVGTLKANEAVLVKSEAQGKIAGIYFEEGTRVKKDDLLVKLEDDKTRAEIERLSAQINQHEIQLANTERTIVRKKRLLKDEVIPEQEFDDLVARKGIEEALIRQFKAELLLEQDKLKDTEIRAPFDGILSERLVSIGDYIAVGDPIVRVVQVSPLKLSFRVSEKYKKQIRVGMTVNISVESFPGETFAGATYFVSPDVDVETRSFLIKAKVPNADQRLNPGMFAKIALHYETHIGALIIPWDALVRLEDRAFVFLIADGAARQVPVEVVKVFQGKAEVTGNLSPGQTVIADGKFTVEDGDHVAIQEKGEDTRQEVQRTFE